MVSKVIGGLALFAIAFLAIALINVSAASEPVLFVKKITSHDGQFFYILDGHTSPTFSLFTEGGGPGTGITGSHGPITLVDGTTYTISEIPPEIPEGAPSGASWTITVSCTNDNDQSVEPNFEAETGVTITCEFVNELAESVSTGDVILCHDRGDDDQRTITLDRDDPGFDKKYNLHIVNHEDTEGACVDDDDDDDDDDD